MRQSDTKKAIVFSLVGIIASGVISVMAYQVMRVCLDQAMETPLELYIASRANEQIALFEDAREFTQSASDAFQRRLDHPHLDDVDAAFDRLFPLMPDGTRRSAPELYDGTEVPGGDWVFGIGAFLSRGDEITRDEKRFLLAAYHTVRTVGEAHLGDFTSLYYASRDSRVIMFAPLRPGRLEFYRIHAPADMHLQADEDPELYNQATNPNFDHQCTRLSHLLSDTDGGARAAISCRRPFMMDGEPVGLLGTTIHMEAYLSGAVVTDHPYSLNLVLNRDNEVIARSASAEDAPEIDVFAITDMLDRQTENTGVIHDPARGSFIAFARFEDARWTYVTVVSTAANAVMARNWSQRLFLALTTLFLSLGLGFAALRMRLRCDEKVENVKSAIQSATRRSSLSDVASQNLR